MSNSKNLNPLKSLLPLNSALYPTRFHLSFRAPIPRNAFSTKDPIFRLCKLGNKIELYRSFLTNWNISNNVATNLINSFMLDYTAKLFMLLLYYVIANLNMLLKIIKFLF